MAVYLCLGVRGLWSQGAIAVSARVQVPCVGNVYRGRIGSECMPAWTAGGFL